jgi:F-type H+-transporting ATPase subunit gamma
MAQTSDIKRRIRSIKNTQQITRAMKMVAAAKLRRAQDKMMAMRPYADKLHQTLRYLAVDLVGDEHPLFRKREVKRVATIVIAGDRGLCGGFNNNLVKFAKNHIKACGANDHVLFAIGKRAISPLRKGGNEIIKAYHDVFDKLSYVLSGEICEQLVNLYMSADESKRIDEAYVVYNEFLTSITQQPVVKKILPIDFEQLAADRKAELESDENTGIRPIYEIEPDPSTAIERLISRRIATDVFQATLESYAAELAARMNAMENATNNADEMVDKLTLIYNRVRQTGITSELLDIVNGANALA